MWGQVQVLLETLKTPGEPVVAVRETLVLCFHRTAWSTYANSVGPMCRLQPRTLSKASAVKFTTYPWNMSSASGRSILPYSKRTISLVCSQL